MQIAYKCPVCRANNLLTAQNQICRRCKSDLGSIYRLKKKSAYKIVGTILKGDF